MPHLQKVPISVTVNSNLVRTVLSLALMLWIGTTASAESGWVERFLERYRPPQAAASTAASPAEGRTLREMAQNGAISLTTEDSRYQYGTGRASRLRARF